MESIGDRCRSLAARQGSEAGEHHRNVNAIEINDIENTTDSALGIVLLGFEEIIPDGVYVRFNECFCDKGILAERNLCTSLQGIPQGHDCVKL
jgi:hypothetical protein